MSKALISMRHYMHIIIYKFGVIAGVVILYIYGCGIVGVGFACS